MPSRFDPVNEDSFTSSRQATFRSQPLSTTTNRLSTVRPEPEPPASPAPAAAPTPAPTPTPAPPPPTGLSSVFPEEDGGKGSEDAGNDPDGDENLGAGVDNEFGALDAIGNLAGFISNPLGTIAAGVTNPRSRSIPSIADLVTGALGIGQDTAPDGVTGQAGLPGAPDGFSEVGSPVGEAAAGFSQSDDTGPAPGVSANPVGGAAGTQSDDTGPAGGGFGSASGDVGQAGADPAAGGGTGANAGTDTSSEVGTGGAGGGAGDSGSCVIFQELHRQGLVRRSDVYTSVRYHAERMDEVRYRGYLAWAVPWRNAMRRSPRFARFSAPMALAWSREMGHRLGLRRKGSLKGKAVSAVFDNLTWACARSIHIVNQHLILTPYRRAKLTPPLASTEVVPVVHGRAPRGFV